MKLARRPRFTRSSLLALLLLLFTQSVVAVAAPDPWAPFDAPWFDRIDISAGLPHSTTTAVAQDSSGLVWIGTMGGLVRYDGYRMQVYEAATRNVPGLPDAYVRNLLALPDRRVLIGTNAGGLARFDAADNSFKSIRLARAARRMARSTVWPMITAAVSGLPPRTGWITST